MSILSTALLLFTFAFSLLMVFALGAQWIVQAARKKREIVCGEALSAIMKGGQGTAGRETYRAPRAWMPLLDTAVLFFQTVDPSDEQRLRIVDFFARRRADLFFVRQLRSRSVYKRCRAAFYLGYLKTPPAVKAVTLSLKQERKQNVKLYLISALCNLEASSSLPDIIDALQGCPLEFITRITGLLLDFQSSFTALFPELMARREPEILALIVEFARLAPYGIFSEYLIGLFKAPDTERDLSRKIFECLMESYPHALNPADYLDSADPALRDRALESLGARPGKANAAILLARALDGENSGKAIACLSLMAQKSTAIFLFLTEIAKTTEDERRARVIYRVLSCRLEYFLLKLDSLDGGLHEKIISEAMAAGKLSDLVSFLNNNHDIDIENALIAVIQKNLASRSGSVEELRMYLKDTILQKIGFAPLPLPQKRINAKNESIRRGPLVLIMLGALAVYPSLFCIFLLLAPGAGWQEAARSALNSYLLAFGAYTFTVNAFYFFLASLAWLEADKQKKFRNLKDSSFLFRKNLLPSISILAPAYCEEKSIVSSVEALLNVNYPDFEVIVINDGSSDGTLALLIERFNLEKTDAPYSEILQTQPIRGIYTNPRIPELKVIDKINGGKADSLNVGVNAASREYILGIDSDSILERDALLTLTSAFLDEETTVVASGGNIMPVNGCTVDRGVIVSKRIPSRIVPLFQTIEYFRAFMNGRMGWSALNSLMIISGAFGLFRRENVLEINGYLTSREKYEKDTVGEDMELVVRLARSMRESGRPHRILYNFMSNCWTEVPSSLFILKKQRDRWQRGLIDILSFHKVMMGNPRYGIHGLLGFPYFWIFEVIGPWFETLGAVLFIGALAAGILDADVFRFLIGSNFLFSFALSAASLYISDMVAQQFPVRDRLILIATSLLETLGFRQLLSFFRITGYIAVIRKVTGWGSMKRAGFKEKKRPAG